MLIKQFLCALVLLAFSCQLLNCTFVVTSYYTNTAAYAKNCENKAKPQLACHGKCQMMKKLKAEEKKEQQNTENRKQLVLSSRTFYPSLKITGAAAIHFPAALNTGNIIRMPRSVFHPPSA